MSLKTLDVAIGTVFLFLLLTFIASAILEFISRTMNWRAKNLYAAIASMLEGSELVTPAVFVDNPMIVALGRDSRFISRFDILERMGWRPPNKRVPPSYIPPAIFSGAVLEVLLREAAVHLSAEQRPVDLSPDGAITAIRLVVGAQLDSSDALSSVLITTLATQGSSIQAVRLALEKWFNDTMDRASGWYKRRTQSVLLAFGLITAFACNIDTIAVVQWLWKSDAARQAVLVAATNYEKQGSPGSKPVAGYGSDDPNYTKMATRVAGADQTIYELQYPVGWNINGKPSELLLRSWSLERRDHSQLSQYLLGCLLTAIAISMGSTFWFGALESLINIRSSGPKPPAR